jgi:hypothetical protein
MDDLGIIFLLQDPASAFPMDDLGIIFLLQDPALKSRVHEIILGI